MRLYLEPHTIGVGVFGGRKLVEYGVNVSDYCLVTLFLFEELVVD